MKNINKFYKWYTKHCNGIIPTFIEIDNFDKLNYIDLQVSSFKHRANEIKERFNHKFKTNPLLNFPNLDNLEFVAKN